MHNAHHLSRRSFLGGLSAGAVSLATERAASASDLQASKPWPSSRSANGWPIGGPSRTHRVEGSALDLTLADGVAATLLIHAARRINYELDSLRTGDITGLTRNRLVASTPRSNLLSGTAIHFRPEAFPLGTDGNLFADQIVVFEDIVAEAGGALSWGGHLAVPDQGLIYLTSAPGAGSSERTARVFREQDAMSSSSGAGAIDAFEPTRRRAAIAFARKKR